MSNFIINWWRSQQLKSALRRSDHQSAIKILQEIQKSGASFSWLEKLFRDKLQLERTSQENKREITNLKKQITEATESKSHLSLKPDREFIKYIYQTFELVDHDEYKLQVTGIDQSIFDDLEVALFKYLQEQFSKITKQKSEQKLIIDLKDALDDINGLKAGKDPEYSLNLTPHVYFMKYFLENVYCLYLFWFLIYQNELLPTKLNILDIAAGPGTTAYGLALFLQSCSSFFSIPQMHVSYYSFEKQDTFQYRGLQFWRKYIESQINPINNYFRFVTADIFSSEEKYSNIPKNFFNFIVISHCFFADDSKRIKANNIYKEIFTNSLSSQGYVMLIIQDKKLFKAYNTYRTEDKEQEKNVVYKFVEELGLKLVWYKYLTSTGLRKSSTIVDFAKFARENLPKQVYISSMLKKYFDQNYESKYTLDDYVIIAKNRV
ncbi:photosystem II assembly protein [Dolichospermum circinale CS-534/05]|uniref:photosystem II assembly protein n=1 Tax=Dolichospermum circinale TaxID=109265 RepID=UPI00232CDCF1|nr:photosystem II assembly protein [Dolichospermum circinale]MDB9467877.1 photosystem II assembly protein [Dolichospermum circinale CS-539/09]MDB9470892.1 photosystem II assembly protein [Dolichospermum circinale CS-539]MDB9491928.1 photosystem II assembly protein [Dolichospermum circinale CS-534/05]